MMVENNVPALLFDELQDLRSPEGEREMDILCEGIHV
jgi:hypothetical protein